MADLTITAADVALSQNTSLVTDIFQSGQAGIAPGKPVYFNTSDSKYKLADANETSPAEAPRAAAIALSYAGLNEYFFAVTRGKFILGATLAVGTVYVVSGNVGMIAPIADAASGWEITILGVATSTTVLDLQINASQASV
jgi:hypothetical protein